ncbi:MAG: isoprenylcysteine carboxylmethyltransferase family protein [Variibacter sp.]
MASRLLVQTVVWLVAIAALLFLTAGTWAWPQAWIFLALLAIGSLVLGLWLAIYDPALLAERMKPTWQAGQPGWDRAFLVIAFVVWCGWLVLIGLDARFHAIHPSVWTSAFGVLAMGACYALSYWTFRENTFASPIVRVQRERRQKTITTGPYAYVRHPLYAAAILFFGVPLLLGSRWGLWAAPIAVAILAARAVLEERELAAGLEGYEAYRHAVPYRLIPYVW